MAPDLSGLVEGRNVHEVDNGVRTVAMNYFAIPGPFLQHQEVDVGILAVLGQAAS